MAGHRRRPGQRRRRRRLSDGRPAALRRLAGDETAAAARVTLMVDSRRAARPGRRRRPARPRGRPCGSASTSTPRCGRPAAGCTSASAARPMHSPDDAAALARAVVAARPGFRLVGLMAYEAQIAGVQDAPARRPVRGLAVRRMQAVSGRELAARRAAVVAAVSDGGPARVRQRRRHRQRRAHRRRAGRHRGGRGVGALLPHAVRRVPRLRRPAGRVLRAPGDALPGPRHGDRGRRRLGARPGPPGPRPAARCRPTRPACRWLAAEGTGEVQTPLRGPGTAAAADRRPRVVPARQGRGAVRARRRPAHPRAATGSPAPSAPTAARATPSATSAQA